MADSTEDSRLAVESRRAGRELVLELVFRPLSNLLAPPLVRARVPPSAVVLANALAGLAAAFLIARGELVGAALLLQLKSLLDNTDGQLARATDRVTLAGRYLDTEADLVVNAALLAALGYEAGRPLLALLAFAALTLVLAADYNATELYRERRGPTGPDPPPTGSRGERALAAIYAAVFAPLDRLVRGISARRGTRIDDVLVTVLANLGLTTQLAALGLCLALGAPAVYLWLVLACLSVVALLLSRRERGR